MSLEIRTLNPDDVPGWHAAVATGFLQGPRVSERWVETRSIDRERTQGAYDGDRCVGTFRTIPQQLTVPGGATLPACAVTNVTVTATHRRRGLLSSMMAGALTAAKERGDAMASLIAAEYPIYGRYGFGPASWTCEYEVDALRAGIDPRYAGPPPGEGRVDLIDAAEARTIGPELHERFRHQPERQGAIDRNSLWWSRHTAEIDYDDGYTLPFFALYRDADGEPQGLAAYTVDEVWEAKLPRNPATVHKLIGTTVEAERALWFYLISMDWVTSVRAPHRAPDDVLPLLLPDPRAARLTTHADFLWLRPLDVPRMLEARTYPVAGTLVLELADKAGLAGGRFRLEAGPDGSKCAPTGDEPDLSCDIGELGTLFLGDEAATRLVTLGRITEHRAGTAATADLLFRTARRPWCPDVF